MTIELVPILTVSLDRIDALLEVELELFHSYRAQVARLDPHIVPPFILQPISLILALFIQTGLFPTKVFVL